MGMLIGAALVLFGVGALALFMLFHLIFSLPLWLMAGGVALYVWMRRGGRRHRLGSGRSYDRILERW